MRPNEEGTRFACAACGGTAAVIRLVPADTEVDMGPMLGPQQHPSDGVLISQWLGTSWQYVTSERWAQVRELLAAAQPDPGALHALHWELAPYWCRGCQRCYCTDHWQRLVIMDEGFYDYSDGTCPAGHRQMIDD